MSKLMIIYVDNRRKKVSRRVLRKIMDELGINPEEYLVVRNGELLTGDRRIREGDKLKLLPIVSGG